MSGRLFFRHLLMCCGIAFLTACAHQSGKTVAPTEDAAVISPWSALLVDDPLNPDAHYALADYYSKRWQASRASTDKKLALYHGRHVLIARPDDLAATTLLYGIYYGAARQGEDLNPQPLTQLYEQIAEPLRRGFYPPGLAFYLRQLDAPVKDRLKERQLLLKAIQQQPENGLLQVQLSRYFFELKAIDLGFASLYQALRLEPDNAEILLALADAYKNRAYYFDCVYDHLDDLKLSASFYKQVLSKKADAADAHLGLMVAYAHLGLAPLSLREGDLWLEAKPGPVNQWSLAIFKTYLGQVDKADYLFKAAAAANPQIGAANRGYIEHLMTQGQWAAAAQAFPAYIQAVAQPNVVDLISAIIIRAELDDDKIKLNTLWTTEKKASYFSPWEESLAKFWRSEMSENDFRGASHNSCQAADMEFYVGYFKLLHNKVGEAKIHFAKAKQYPQPLNFERKLAETLLHNL